MSTTNQNRCTATKLVRGEGCGNQTNRGAASCAPIEPETNCAVADLRPLVARLARVGRPAPVGGHRRRGGLRRCSRARSEERRVGKECRSRWCVDYEEKKLGD